MIMKDLRRLLAHLEGMDGLLSACMRCGMCQAVCPLYAETLNEMDVARGKLAMLEGLASKLIHNPRGVQKSIERCLLCGACQVSCPNGVRAMDVFLRARLILTEYQGLSTSRKVIFRGMLSRPRLLDGILHLGARLQHLFLDEVKSFPGTVSSSLLSSFLGERHLVPLSPGTFTEEVASRFQRAKGRRSRTSPDLSVAFFHGCLVDKVFPKVGEAVWKVLDHHAFEMVLPEGLVCCGMPALAAGDGRTFKHLVGLNLEALARRHFDVLVTPCATCTFAIRKVWPLFAEEFHVSQRPLVATLASSAVDISAFLVDHPGIGPSLCPHADPEASGRVQKNIPDSACFPVLTYHDPCHLRKSLGVVEQPRRLLRSHPGFRFVETSGTDGCCGSGGSFNLAHYDCSLHIGAKKREVLLATGAQVVATGCPACMMHLMDVFSRHGDRVNVRHTIEVYAESLG